MKDLILKIEKLKESKYRGEAECGKDAASVKRQSMEVSNLLADLRMGR